MVSQVCPAKPGDRETGVATRAPAGRPTKAPLRMAGSSQWTSTCTTTPHDWKEDATDTARTRAQFLSSTSPAGALEGSSTSGSEHSILYLNIEQVQLHGVSRVHILIRVKELPSKQQCFIFIYSLFSECSAVIQPIYCKARWHMKELCLLFLFSSRGLSKIAAWGRCGFLKCSCSVIVAS